MYDPHSIWTLDMDTKLTIILLPQRNIKHHPLDKQCEDDHYRKLQTNCNKFPEKIQYNLYTTYHQCEKFAGGACSYPTRSSMSLSLLQSLLFTCIVALLPWTDVGDVGKQCVSLWDWIIWARLPLYLVQLYQYSNV